MQLSLDPTLLLGIGVIAVLAFLVLAFFVLPRRYVRDLPDLGPPPEGDRISLKDQVTIADSLKSDCPLSVRSLERPRPADFLPR
jgi:hypothetical protein